MLNWSDYMVQQERYKSLLAEADIERLLMQPDTDTRAQKHSRLHQRAMAAFGRRLVAWGWRLQGAHDHTTTATVWRQLR